MSAPIVVAGATGQLGQKLVSQLLDRGATVRALVRDPARLGPLRDRVEVITGDVLRSDSLVVAMQGARAVFSSLGASVQPSLGAGWRSYDKVDVPANQRLIAAAKAAGVPRFVYVSLVKTPDAGRTAYVKAHEQVVELLRHSGLDWCALRPTGFHSVFASMLDMGRVPYFGDGATRSNPIADVDLAAYAATVLEAPTIDDREPALGGPDVLSRRRIAELACEAKGGGKTMSMPAAVASLMSYLVRPLSPRMSDLLRFAVAVNGEDAIAPCVGTTTLAQSFAAAMAQKRGRRSLSA
jgi:uncharacterized protein YbjT (DUF2867 family)